MVLIVALIAILSITRCAGDGKEVNYSEFLSTVENSSLTGIITDDDLINAPEIDKQLGKYDSAKITSVYIDNYVIEFKIQTVSGSKTTTYTFNTVYARGDTAADLEALLSAKGIAFDYSNPNSGSIWQSLMPLFGAVLIMVVFWIIMAQSQGGTKSAMNFAKTNARLNQNLKVRFTDVAGAEEEKEELKEIVEF